MGRKPQPIAPRLLTNHVKDPDTGCWLWQGGLSVEGYGRISGGRRGVVIPVHRASYMEFVGPIPAGYQIDHTCHSDNLDTCAGGPRCAHRRCINPEHLEAVTLQVNSQRSHAPQATNARRTHCGKGHEFTPEDTYVDPAGGRTCRTCRRRAASLQARQVRIPIALYADLAALASQRQVSVVHLVRDALTEYVA